jgi:ClpP class serine protease
MKECENMTTTKQSCRNPFCVLRKCRFRTNSSDEAPNDDSEKIGCSFSIKKSGIGILMVLGSINETSEKATNNLLHHVDKLTGLLVVIHSSGGFGKNINHMRDAVLNVASRDIPTVSWIDRACSGACEVAVSCKTVFCNHDAEAGGLGVTVFQCYQGIYPALLVSNLTPKKNPETERGPESICCKSLGKVNLIKIQNEIDIEAKEILKFLANQRGLPFKKIKESRIGCGNVLKADELLREGLIDRICTGEEAFTELIMQVLFGEKYTEKGEQHECTEPDIQKQ